jgi:hypothetical protein
MTHTPGPWATECVAGAISIRGNPLRGGPIEVALVKRMGPMGTADARLIAAAPDCLAQLKSLVCLIEELDPDAWDERVTCREALETARAAIAKAEGK